MHPDRIAEPPAEPAVAEPTGATREHAGSSGPQRIPPNPSGLRVVVLISGGGSNLAALLAAQRSPDYGARIVAVGADRHSAAGLQLARDAGLPTFVHRISDYRDREAWDLALTAETASHQPDLVVSAGFLKLVGPHFLSRFPGRYINTHNALLPAFPGMHGPADALAYGVKIAGATLFVVDAGVDSGPILAQVAVPVLDDDTEDSLTERIKTAERAQLVEQVSRMARHGWTIHGRRVFTEMTQSSGAPTSEPTAEPAGGRRPITRALLSVSDKSGLVELATALVESGVAIVSTGGSAALLADAGLPVQKVEDVTGFPECLDGRVKTLHPKIHGGLLADTRKQSHLDQLQELGIEMFDLVVVNLYPFRATVASGASPDECIEQIDIGGPAMIRASAKNHPSVATVVEPGDYAAVIEAASTGGFTLAQRQELAAKAFAHTASYDVAVASWMNYAVAPDPDGWPRWTGSTWERQSVLRYGENPHQKAALYRHWRQGLAGAQQLHGKEMSYNNYVDVDAAWRAASDFTDPAVAIIKHANPCGIAVVVGGDEDSIAAAHVKALASDPVSAFGGVIAVNRRVTVPLAEQIAEVFTEVLLAPGFDDAALAILTRKKNIRLLVMPADANTDPIEFRGISGGILAQTRDAIDAPGDDPSSWILAAGPAADADTLADLDFAWRACRSVKSNAILLARDGGSVGIGMGQVNRVDSARLAVERAGDRAAGSVAASDAYFPFADGPEILFNAGIKAVVQPGGSVRDPEVIAAAEAAGVSLYLTGTRHFFH